MATIIMPPCYKYIARNINSDKERYYYSKNYFANMDNHKVGADEQLTLYISVQLNQSCGSALSYNGVGLSADEYRATIMESPDIADVVSCTNYYKQVCAPGRNSVCSTCPFSKTYTNDMYSDECSIFKYIITSRDNLISFANIGTNAIFRSSFDVGADLMIGFAGIIKLLSVAYDQLVALQEEVYQYDDVKDRLECLVGKISAKSSSMNSNVKEIQASNFKALPVTWSGIVSDILSSKLLTDAEVSDIVQKIDCKYGKKNKKKRASKEKEPGPLMEFLGATTLDEGARVDTLPAEVEPTIEIDAPDDIPESAFSSSADESAFDNMPDYVGDGVHVSDEEWAATFNHVDADFEGGEVSEPVDIPDDIGNIPAPDFIPDEAFSDEGTSGDADDSEPGEAVQKEQNIDSEVEDVVESASVDITPDKTVSSAENKNSKDAQVKTVQNNAAKKYSVPAHSEQSYIYYLILNKRTLKDFAYSVDGAPAEFVNALRKSKVLPVEVVFDEETVPYLFMFVKNLGRFYYCKIVGDMPPVVVALLQSQSIRKICYQPYYLYSVCRLYEIRVHQVYSLYSMDAFLHPAALPCKYDEFWELYKNEYSYTPLSGSKFPDFDLMCDFMQCYIQMNARHLRAINDEKRVKEQLCRDEVLGSSFLRIINMKSNEYLLDLDSDGNVVYNMSYDVSARNDGFIITYTIGADDIPELSRQELYMMGLVELSSKGRFSKYNIQLITMSDVSMVLFVGIREYELVITQLQKFYHRYAQKQHLERFSLSVDHQRIYVKDKPYPVKIALPKSYDEAMDRYITTNDTITISDEHVSVRGKKTQKSRKRQPQKFSVK